MIVLIDYDPKGNRVKTGAAAFDFRNANGDAITARLRSCDCKDEEVRAAGFPGRTATKATGRVLRPSVSPLPCWRCHRYGYRQTSAATGLITIQLCSVFLKHLDML